MTVSPSLAVPPQGVRGYLAVVAAAGYRKAEVTLGRRYADNKGAALRLL